MWKKYKDFLRKRTDMQVLVGIVIAILIILVSVILAISKVWGIIPFIVTVLLAYFVMITFGLEVGYRDAENCSKELIERLRKQLKERVRKELEAKK